jgi:hypothetical protein
VFNTVGDFLKNVFGAFWCALVRPVKALGERPKAVGEAATFQTFIHPMEDR